MKSEDMLFFPFAGLYLFFLLETIFSRCLMDTVRIQLALCPSVIWAVKIEAVQMVMMMMMMIFF